MDLGIKGKVAVVAASSSGLGLSVAEALAAEGVNLAICSRDKTRIQKAADHLRDSFGIDVLPFVCDVVDRKSVLALREATLDHFKTCHVLFTNSGGPPSGSIGEFKSEDFKNALELNLLSTINLIENFLPAMKKQKWGRIIALASISVKQPLTNLALSNVSRVGVVAYIKTLSTAVAHLNITANTLAPGYFLTGRVEQLLKDQAQNAGVTFDDSLQKLLGSIPAQRTGNPVDFGSLVAFLASEQASYITGDTILIDGGMYQGLM
jgi:3-oxoacyl-[acyl-carrier protein] reductase